MAAEGLQVGAGPRAGGAVGGGSRTKGVGTGVTTGSGGGVAAVSGVGVAGGADTAPLVLDPAYSIVHTVSALWLLFGASAVLRPANVAETCGTPEGS